MKKRVIIRFTRETIDKPIVYRLVKEYELICNILRANISPRADSMMVLEMEGTDENYGRAAAFLNSLNLEIQPIEQDINRDESKCVHCGVCTNVCAPGALYINREQDMRVEFDYKRCVACAMCLKVCPVRAMNVFFE